MRGLLGICVRIVAAMGAAVTFAASAQSVTVVEYYNKAIDAYFITGRANEQAILDGVADFQRTGMTFQATAVASAPATLTKICRFYVSAASPYVSSHFYGRQGVDCEPIRAQNLAGFSWEDYDFATQQPSGGVCPAATTPIYRGFRAAANGKTSNHRYSASQATYDAAIAAGYVGEQAAFCASAATPATVTTTPPSSGDCGTFYYSGKRISYQSSFQSSGLSGTTTSAVTRAYDSTPVTFNGQAATRIVDTPVPGDPSYNYIVDGTNSWSFLGSRSTSNGVAQDTYFTPPQVYPKSMTIGQTINMNQTVSFNPASFLGNATLTGTIVLTSRESVTVPAGTFANACKFTINQTTTYPSVGSTSNTRTIAWIAPGVGNVRSEVTDTSSVLGQSVVSTTVLIATSVQ